ncbi:MAG: SGNH/GDSL hydrolase family protein [Candidatus Thorarchaeota archaeon SMTZ1-45]|nr:MAG: hypothetical protein AM325_09835 [Candidatus Thorarchaeota archaeon SMTZ1-45]
MLGQLLFLFGLLILVLIPLTGYAFYQSMKKPEKTPSTYLRAHPQKDVRKSVVVFLGDSITHGRVGVNYVDMVQERFESESFEFINAGINSELAWNNLQRVEEVIQCDPDVVTVLIGTDDVNATMSSDAMKSYVMRMKLPRDPDSSWYEDCLQSLVKRLRTETNARIALLSIPPIGEDFSHPAFIRSSEYSSIIQHIAEEMNVAYLPFIVCCTILDTRALYSQETALGGLCEVRCVSGRPQSSVA